MLQVLRKGLKDIVVEEVPEPTIGSGEVKIKTGYSLISSGTEIAGLHTDGLVKEVIREKNRVSALIGRAVKEQGIIKTTQALLDKFKELSLTGYSGAGIIIEKAKDITDLEVGQKVAYGGAQTGHAQFVCVPRNLVAPVPDNVSLKEAALTTVGSIALHAIRNTSITVGDTVAVVGLGLVGQIVVQLAKIAGARVFGIDIKKDRLAQAINQGAEVAVSALENPKIILNNLTNGQGVDKVIICASSKTSEPLELAVDISRSRAHIIVVGMVKMELPWEQIYKKELKLMVSRAYGPGSYDTLYEKKGIDYPLDYVRWTENRNMGEFLRLLQDGRVQSQNIITHEFLLQEAPIAFQKLASGEEGIIGAILRYPDFEHKEESGKKVIQIAEAAKKSQNRQQRDLLRVGVIGLGNIARWVHLPNINNHPNLKLRGVCTPKGYKAKHLGVRFKSEYCTTDFRQIIEDPEIDIVLISTRNDLHAAIAIEAMNAGKHVFLEKPMAMTRDECFRLVQAVKETNLGLMVNFNRRYSSMYTIAKEATSGKGPKLISVRMNSPDMTGSYWMMDPVEGGGAVLGEGCHFFDLMAWFADSEPATIFAQNLILQENEQTTKNNIVCAITFKDGSVGNLIYETIGHRGVGSERVEISAGGTTAVVDDMRKMWIWNGSFAYPKKKKRFRADKGYYQLLDVFVEGILKGQNFEDEAKAGAMATLCALAALKSIETGLPEKVEAIQ